MRNDDNRAAEGPQPDDGTGEVYASVMARRSRRRKQALAGVVGLAALLGAGAFAVTQQLADDPATVQEVGAQAPVQTPGATASVGSASGTGSSAPSGATRKPTSSPAPRPAGTDQKPGTVEERVAAARTAASKAGTTVRNPLRPTGDQSLATAANVTVTESGSVGRDGRTLRVFSARQDLTGHRELAWAADNGVPVGDARCTQRIRLSADAPAVEKPTLLLCWRTSAKKSVYTIAVDVKGRPSKQASVAAIDKQWAKLG